MKSLRTLEFATAPVSSIRHVALVPEVHETLIRWLARQAPEDGRSLLIGGLAMSFYAKPRQTADVDLLFLRESDIPDDVDGFKSPHLHRRGAFLDVRSHVEIEVATPSFINLPQRVAEHVFKTARPISTADHRLLIPSVEGFVVLKLYGALTSARKYKDLGDIQSVLEYNEPDLDDWRPLLTEKQWEMWMEVKDASQRKD